MSQRSPNNKNKLVPIERIQSGINDNAAELLLGFAANAAKAANAAEEANAADTLVRLRNPDRLAPRTPSPSSRRSPKGTRSGGVNDNTPPRQRIPPPAGPPAPIRPNNVQHHPLVHNGVARNLQAAFDAADHEEAERRLAPPTPPRNHREPPQNGGINGGGKVKKAGMYMLNKNDVVLPADRVKEVEKALKMAGMKPLKK